jgi:hypothetical protein
MMSVFDIDPNMERFWIEATANLPYQLYYNHSTLANTELFPRATTVSWGGLNSYGVQTELVHRVIWIIDQLVNVTQPAERLMIWQEARITLLQNLREIYVNKLDIIGKRGGVAVGMIPKWYRSKS